MSKRYTKCIFCDGGCTVSFDPDEDAPRVRPANPDLPAICSKVNMIDEYRFHPDRLTTPLKRVGERGTNAWEPLSWDQALDEIAARLQDVIREYGPESFAVSEAPLNMGFGGITRRFMNCLGSPNYIIPLQLCMGNTAQIHRAVYGWFAFSNWEAADCVVYFGQNRDMEHWPVEYLRLKAALSRGAKLIVVDPRKTKTAEIADCYLPIRYGTDAALLMSWINVIIEEGLYDRDFVTNECLGFDEVKTRAASYAPERVSEICGISAQLVRESARMYATAQAGIIPWGVVGDMQSNSTSVLHAQCILRAICGNLRGAEPLVGPAQVGVTNAELAAFDWLSQEQREKQLGTMEHPILSSRTAPLYKGACERKGISYEPDLLGTSHTCNAPALFAAMRGEGPYPVKAFFSVANNTVMSYAGQQGIVEAMLSQELVVVFENWMTPTAQLADYVLPGDMWAERDILGSTMDVAPNFSCGQAFCEPVEECKNWYYVIKGLADRMGLEDKFPWQDCYELYDWRLAPLGVTWENAIEQFKGSVKQPFCAEGFGTPSGEVELKSSVFEALGYDPLPSYVEPADPGACVEAFPYVIFAGARERMSYNTNLHQIPELRKVEPEPLFYINPDDAAVEGVEEETWWNVETAYGCVELMAHVDALQSAGTLRVPHGWWKPEREGGLAGNLSCANLHNDGILFPDDAWNLDPLQGIPNLRGGLHARISKK